MKPMRILKAVSLIIPAGGILAFYAYIGTFSRLMADDYCLIYFADRLGLLRSIWYWYLNWHGNFSANLIDVLLVPFPVRGVRYVVAVCLLLWIGTASFSFSAIMAPVLKGYYRAIASVAISSVLIVLVLVWSPNTPQSLFWWAGLRKYTLPLVIVSLYPGLLLIYLRSHLSRWGIFFWHMISFLILFFAGGFNETFSPAFVGLLALIIALLILSGRYDLKDKASSFLSAGFIGSLAALLVMLLAPGNSVRQSYFPENPGIFSVARIALDGYWDFLGDIIGSPVISMAFAGAILGVMNIGLDSEPGETQKGWPILAAVLAAILVPYFCFVPFAYVASDPLVDRALITPAFLFVAFILYASVLSGQWISSRAATVDKTRVSLGLLLFTVLFMTGLAWRHGTDFYHRSRVAVEYAEYWDRTTEIIARAEQDGEERVTIPRTTNWALIFEPNDNPKFYVNDCMAKYFGIEIVARESLDE